MTNKRKVSELSKNEEEKAQELLNKSICINALDSTPVREMHDEYFSKLMKTGVTSMNATVYALAFPPGDPLRKFINDTATNLNMIQNSKKAILATSVQNIRQAKKDGKIAVIFGTQNADFIEDPSWISVCHKLDFRIIQLTYQNRNKIGDGCGEREQSGLSKFGVKVVEDLNEKGIVIDFAHVGPATTLDAIEVSKDPVIFSHNAVKSMSDMVRNKTDEELHAMAEKGGVMGIAPKSNFLKWRGAKKGTTIEDYMDHIDYVVDLVGIDHIGIGLDVGNGRKPHGNYADADGNLTMYTPIYFPEIGIWMEGDEPGNMHTEGLNPPMPRIINIAKGALARGYSDQEIEKILGGNFIRVFEKVW